jgi:hypothetical protein
MSMSMSLFCADKTVGVITSEDAAQSGREPSAYPVSRASFIAGATDN